MELLPHISLFHITGANIIQGDPKYGHIVSKLGYRFKIISYILAIILFLNLVLGIPKSGLVGKVLQKR